MGKRYYWLKLPDDFFRQKPIKKLRKIAGGDTYTIIYLKMLLIAMKQDGRLYFEGVEDDFYEELALELDEEAENVNVTVRFLLAQGLIELVDETEYRLTECDKMVGSEAASTQRSRQCRERKALQCNTNATPCNTLEQNGSVEKEIEKEIEIEKEREGETGHPTPAAYGRYNNVILTDTELSGLKTELPDKWEYYIDRLSCHIASTGKQYHSHAATIYKWAQEDAAKGKAAPKQGIPDYSCKEGESL